MSGIRSRKPAFDPGTWGCEVNTDGHLELDGCDLVGLARTHGTPTHVVSKTRLTANCERARAAFTDAHGSAELFYSYKTNCVPGILRLIHEQGIGAEVISPYELWLARRLGLPGERIVYNGPHKTSESLEQAVQCGVKLINVDSFADLGRLLEVCRAGGRKANVGVRLRSSAGWGAHFGFGIENGEAAEAVRRIQQSERLLELRGLHLHLGSQITDRAVFRRAIGEALRFLDSIGSDASASVEFLDVGGGFGVPTVRELGGLERRLFRLLGRPLRAPAAGSCPRLEDFGETIRRELDRHAAHPLRLVTEPGRAITSDAQILLLGVIARKDGRTPVAVLDGGCMNVTRPTSFEYHHLLVANKMREAKRLDHKLVGRTCTPSDVLYDHATLPALAEGDVVAVMDAGAYFTSFSNDFAFPRPAIVLADSGHTSVLRERGTFEGMVSRDVLDWPGGEGLRGIPGGHAATRERREGYHRVESA